MDGFDPEDLLTFDLAPGATEVTLNIILDSFRNYIIKNSDAWCLFYSLIQHGLKN